MAHTSPYPVLDGAGRPLPVGDGAGRKRLASRLRAGRRALGTARAGLALRGEGRPCGAGFVPRALEGTEREHGRLPFRAGGNGGGGIRRKAKPQGLACVSAGAGPATPDGADAGKPGAVCTLAPCRAASGRDDAGPMLRRELVPLRRGGPCRRERQVRALCRPEGAALSSPGPAGGERGNALPGFPCPGAFPAPRPFQRWREQRGGRAGEGEDAAHRADETRAEGMRWQAAGPHIAWLEEPCRWARGRAASAAGRRGAESVFRMAHLSEILPFPCRRERRRGRPGVGPGWLEEPCRWLEGRAASAAAGARKASE